jgi:hypothetical protein
MRIRRAPFFWGLLLLSLGSIPLLVRAGALDPAWFAEVWRLWPVLLIVLGLLVVLGRGRARSGLAATGLVAITLGLAAGGVLASGNLWLGGLGDCTSTAGAQRTTQDGTFETAATVALDLDCGAAVVTMTTAPSWTVTADHVGPPPAIEASATSLTVRAPQAIGPRRQDWDIALPAGQTRTIDLTANAAASTLILAGGTLDRVRADSNAADLQIDASQAVVSRLDITMNAGRARVTLGGGSTTGSLTANAGALELCVPPDVGLVLDVTDSLTFTHDLDDNGLTRVGDDWTRSGASGQTVELRIDGNAASFTLDPEGGC